MARDQLKSETFDNITQESLRDYILNYNDMVTVADPGDDQDYFDDDFGGIDGDDGW